MLRISKTRQRKSVSAQYFIHSLKNSRDKDIIFSWDTMLDLEGESASYCQYGYARGRSILRKAEGIDYSNADFSKAASDEAYSLVKAN